MSAMFCRGCRKTIERCDGTIGCESANAVRGWACGEKHTFTGPTGELFTDNCRLRERHTGQHKGVILVWENVAFDRRVREVIDLATELGKARLVLREHERRAHESQSVEDNLARNGAKMEMDTLKGKLLQLCDELGFEALS